MILLLSIFKLVALKVWGDRESLCKFVTAENPYLEKPDTKISCEFSSESRGCVSSLENRGPSRKALPGSCSTVAVEQGPEPSSPSLQLGVLFLQMQMSEAATKIWIPVLLSPL